MNNENIPNAEPVQGVSTRFLKWRKAVYVLGAIILVPIVIASIVGWDTLLVFYPVLMFATPALIISLLWLIVIGISDKFGGAENRGFFGKDWRKTVLIAFLIVLGVGAIMFYLLYEFYL